MREFKKVAKTLLANPSCSRLSYLIFLECMLKLGEFVFHLAKRKLSALANLAKDLFSLALTQNVIY